MASVRARAPARPPARPPVRARHACARPSVTYASLVVTLVVGLYWDDGSGAFYGSGIEVFGFVLLPLLEGYTIGIVIYSTSSVSAWTAHACGACAGALLLFCPALCRALGHYAQGWANTRRGFQLAALLQLHALISVLLQNLACEINISDSVQARGPAPSRRRQRAADRLARRACGRSPCAARRRSSS